MDDVIVLAENEDEALSRLKKTLDLASKYGLRIKWKKCQFLCSQIEFLGYEITPGKIKPSNAKLTAVKRFPQPTDVKRVQSFLGLSGYFRKFIPNYAQIAKPLSDLLRKESSFHFGAAQEDAFNRIKDALMQQPVLLIYNPEADTELHTDASKFGFGAILLQRCAEDNNLHPVFYYSRKTTSAQEKYSSYELEVLAIISALKKLRVYLLGIKFKIVTDCAAFQMTMEKEDLPPRVAIWALYLQDFDYQLEHRSATRMKHVDSLSRNPVSMSVNNDVVSRIAAAQMKDEQFRLIAKLLEKGSFENYTMERGVLYKEQDGTKLLCVPKGMQKEVIKMVHDQGHFGLRKTQELLGREYYIPKLKEKIESCRRNCIACILAEKKSGKQEGWLHPIPKEEYPLSCYHVDHLGPLTATKKSYRYIFAVIDGFSKFAWLYPVKTLTTDEVIQKLELQKNIFGNPRQIISDRGTAFTANKFQEYCERENIQHTLITTGVPRGNGQVERINRVIISVLTKLTMLNPEHWYKEVGKVQRYLNSSWQRSIRRTPYEVMFGIRMRNPENVELSRAIAEEMMELFDRERDEIREEAKRSILEVQDENKRNFDRKRREPTVYQIGDLVAIRRTQYGNATKIQSKFFGPYRVSRIGKNDRYDVTKVGNHEGPKTTTTSCDYMKPWSLYDETCSESEDEDDYMTNDETTPVEREATRDCEPQTP